jgi:F-type H+-transporting ATPase subunit delta
MFRLACEQGRVVPERVRKIVETFLAGHPRAASATLSEFARLIRLELAKRHAVVQSAVELDSTSQSQLLRSLSERFGPDLTSEFQTHPDLVGGLRIQVGSDVWDGSIQGRLASLAKQF